MSVALAVALTPLAVPALADTAGAPETLTVKRDFTESGTWTVPQGVTSVVVTATGGTGGHGGAMGLPAAAGGAGDSLTRRIDVTPGDVLTLTIGTRGGDGDKGGVASIPDPGAGGTGKAAGGVGGYAGRYSIIHSPTGGGGGGSSAVEVGDILVEAAGGGGGGGGEDFAGGAGGRGGTVAELTRATPTMQGAGCAIPAQATGWGTAAESAGYPRSFIDIDGSVPGSGGGGGGAEHGPGGFSAATANPSGFCRAPGQGGNGGKSVAPVDGVEPSLGAPSRLAPGNGWVSLQAERTPVTVTATAPDGLTVGQDGQLDVTVTTPEGDPATGTVKVTFDGLTMTTPLNPLGTLSIPVTPVTSGAVPVTVVWRPETPDELTWSSTVTVASAAVTLSAPAASGLIESAIDFEVTATSAADGLVPTGTITVRTAGTTDASGVLTTADLLDGTATAVVSTAGWATGTRQVEVSYSGDSTHAPSTTQTTLTVQRRTWLIPPNPTTAAYGATRHLDGFVLGAPGIDAPTGTVTATIPGYKPFTAVVTGGKYTLVTPADLAPGVHNVFVAYSGDDIWAPTTDQGFQTVNPGGVTLALTGPATAPVGKATTWTATVERTGIDVTPEPEDDPDDAPLFFQSSTARLGPFAAAPTVAVTDDTVTPTGTVELLVDGDVVDTAELVDGVADLIAPAATTAGKRTVSARYLGSDGYVALDKSADTTDLTITPVSTDGGGNENPGEGNGNGNGNQNPDHGNGNGNGNGNGGTGTGGTGTGTGTTTQPTATPTPTAERDLASTGTSPVLPALGVTLLLAGAVLLTARTTRLRRN